MDMKIFQTILQIRAIATENIEKPTSEQRLALSTLKIMSNLSSSNLKMTDNIDDIILQLGESVKILTTDQNSSWECEIVELWKDATKSYIGCNICEPSREDMENGNDLINDNEGSLRLFLIDGNLIVNENLDYPNKAILKGKVNYCPNYGKEL